MNDRQLVIRANQNELEEIDSWSQITGIKLQVVCSRCSRKWSIWFSGEENLLKNLPENWHICLTCSKNK